MYQRKAAKQFCYLAQKMDSPGACQKGGSRAAGGEAGRSSGPGPQGQVLHGLRGGQKAKFRARPAKLVCSLGCVCPTAPGEDNTGLALLLWVRGLGCWYGLYPVCSRIPHTAFFLLVSWVGSVVKSEHYSHRGPEFGSQQPPVTPVPWVPTPPASRSSTHIFMYPHTYAYS